MNHLVSTIRTFWTDDRIVLLKRYWSEGRSANEIAKLFGRECTRNGVIGKVHRLGLAQRPSPIIRRSVVPIHNIKSCEYPIGEPRKPGFRFCGQPLDGNPVYCNEHHAVCYQKKQKISDAERQRRIEWGRKIARHLNRQRALAAAQRQVR